MRIVSDRLEIIFWEMFPSYEVIDPDNPYQDCKFSCFLLKTYAVGTYWNHLIIYYGEDREVSSVLLEKFGKNRLCGFKGLEMPQLREN